MLLLYPAAPDKGTGGTSLTTGIAVGNGGQCRTGFLGKVAAQATKNLQLTGPIDPLRFRIPVSPPFKINNLRILSGNKAGTLLSIRQFPSIMRQRRAAVVFPQDGT
jgi:hypothetical protein